MSSLYMLVIGIAILLGRLRNKNCSFPFIRGSWTGIDIVIADRLFGQIIDMKLIQKNSVGQHRVF